MTGATIDHLVAVTILLGALLLFIALFNQTIQTAILFQQHRYLATKCSDLLDNILLNPGSPYDWGTNSSSTQSLAMFGLQDPEFQQYRLSSFSLMRLLSTSTNKVYYSQTGRWYNNLSCGLNGGYLLLQEGDCISQQNATRLLGINGTYGLMLSIAPTLTVTIDEVQQDPLKLKVQVSGPGFPLATATLTYLMFWTNSSSGDYPILKSSANATQNTLQTDSSGIAYKEFSSNPYLNTENNHTAYAFIVQANIGGLYGIGYASRDTITVGGNLMPFINDYENGTILLAHKRGIAEPSGNEGTLFFNASFYVLPDNFAPIPVANFAEKVNYGNGTPYQTLHVPSSYQGFLVAAYCKENDYGMMIMPWGIGTIGLPVVFGEEPSGIDWVATDLRQVLVGNSAYQAKLALWSLRGLQVVG